MSEAAIKPPSLKQLLLEVRCLPEWGRFLLSNTGAQELPRGNGRPVLVIPGFGASDLYTASLRRALSRLGHDVHGWGLGLNTGMNSHVRKALAQKVSNLHTTVGQPVSLIGWSLGGVFARELARQLPTEVARVFTLGSPFNITPAANNMLPLFKLVNRGKPVKLDMDGFLRRAEPPPVRCTAIYSKTDGVVDWRTACEREAPNTENIEVTGSHFGMVCNQQVVRVIAERLASP